MGVWAINKLGLKADLSILSDVRVQGAAGTVPVRRQKHQHLSVVPVSVGEWWGPNWKERIIHFMLNLSLMTHILLFKSHLFMYFYIFFLNNHHTMFGQLDIVSKFRFIRSWRFQFCTVVNILTGHPLIWCSDVGAHLWCWCDLSWSSETELNE